MRYFRALAFVLAAVFFAEPAMAECLVCDEVVELDEPTATCFLKQFDSNVSKLETSKTGYVKINLGDCVAKHNDGLRGGLLTMPNFSRPKTDRRVKVVYLFDEDYMRCLHSLLADVDRPIDPVVELDLYESCAR